MAQGKTGYGLKDSTLRLYRAENLDAIARVVEEIAHDFNNVFNVVIGFAAMSQVFQQEPAKVDEYSARIRAAAERGCELTRQLSAFCQKQDLHPIDVDVNQVLQRVAIRIAERNSIDLRYKAATDLQRARLDPVKLEEALTILLANAFDAMPDGGSVQIETANVYLDQGYVQSHADLVPGHYVMVSITDSGTGMGSEVRERLFEPFFSTKARGSGQGLGMATVYGIMRQSEGYIWVDSEPGAGTTFKLYFPMAQASTPAEFGDRSEPMRGTETLLVIEDEVPLLRICVEFLSNIGYSVLSAATTDEALALLQNTPSPDLVLADLLMLGTNGSQLGAEIRKHWPSAPVLLMSTAFQGHADLVPRFDRTGFIGRPFTRVALALKIRELLDRGTTVVLNSNAARGN